jgi:hypothetical protein
MSEDYTGPAKQTGPAGTPRKPRYTVDHRRGREVVWSNTVEDPEEALDSFVNALIADGHGTDSIALAMRTWTVVLMMGGNGYSRMDPDLKGTTSISIKS